MSIWSLSAIFMSMVKLGSLSETRFNHTFAENICHSHGNLFSDSRFTSNNGFLSFQDDLRDLKSELEEGESVWINGYVKYTYFVNWLGCYVLTQNITVMRIDLHLEVYKLSYCIKNCIEKTNRTSYFGLQNNSCLCFSDSTLLARTSNTKCDQFNPSFTSSLASSTDDTVFSVFLVDNENAYSWDQKQLHQCVLARRIATEIRFSTVLCGSIATNIIPCYDSNNASACKQQIQSVCILEKQQSSWLQANALCQNIHVGGTLARPAEMVTYLTNWEPRTPYWTNMFRTFEIASKSLRYVEVPRACLAVSRVEDKLVLDPDDCEQPKRVLCSDGLYNPFKIDQTTFEQENKSETAVPKQENDGASNTAIYVSVAAVLTVIILTVSCCVCYKRKQHFIYKQPLDSTSSGMKHILTSWEYQESSDYAEANVNNTSTATSSKTPKKPSRRTLRKASTTKNSAYENIKINEMNDKRNEIRAVDKEEYDTVELKGANGSRKALEVTYSVGGDTRIYNHTLETDSQEDYDTMKSTKSVRQTLDDTYNKVGCNIGNDDTNNQDTCMYDHTVSGTLKSTTTIDTNLSQDYDN